jgi:hypothetical protein
LRLSREILLVVQDEKIMAEIEKNYEEEEVRDEEIS